MLLYVIESLHNLSLLVNYTEDVRARERALNIEIALYIVLVLICLKVE